MSVDCLAWTRPVGSLLDQGELTHLPRRPIDLELARIQHASYEDVLARLGCRVERLPALHDHPDAVFVEDTLIVLDEMAIVTRPGAPSRRSETRDLEPVVSRYRPVTTIQPPGTLDGGDVMRAGRTLFVGRSGRSDSDGIEALRELVGPIGYAVDAVTVSGCLHLKSAVTLVRDDLLLVNPDWVDPHAFGGIPYLSVDPSEPFAANALRVGGKVVHTASHPQTRARLESAGLDVAPVDLSELAKLEGGVTCCSVLVPLGVPSP